MRGDEIEDSNGNYYLLYLTFFIPKQFTDMIIAGLNEQYGESLEVTITRENFNTIVLAVLQESFALIGTFVEYLLVFSMNVNAAHFDNQDVLGSYHTTNISAGNFYLTVNQKDLTQLQINRVTNVQLTHILD